MNYILVGAGGTGSHLLPALYRYLKAREDQDPNWMLHIIDGDTVEPGNLSRQLFETEHLSTNKAAALAGIANDPAHVRSYAEYLGSSNIARFITEGDVVLIAADNHFVRRLIEVHAQDMTNVTVINGGNEDISGSVQTFIRREGANYTPRLSHLHPEILTEDADRSALSCAQIAQLPGGEQTILANMTSATFMLAALWRVHNDRLDTPKGNGNTPVTEVQFDHRLGEYYGWDVRSTQGAELVA